VCERFFFIDLISPLEAAAANKEAIANHVPEPMPQRPPAKEQPQKKEPLR